MKRSTREVSVGIKAIFDQALSRLKVTEGRLRSLRAYTRAISEALIAHVDEQALTNEELVTVLLGAAYYVQATKNMKTQEK